MKILALGLDNSILNKASNLAVRVIEYGNLVEKYNVIVPSAKKEEISLSEKVIAYGSGGGNKLMQFFKIYNLAKKILREEKYNIITVQDQYYLALIGLCLVKKIKLGLEIQVHGFEKYYGLRKLIAKYVLPRASSVRCVSQRLKKQLINELGIKKEKITVVPIFVDTANLPPLQRGIKGGDRLCPTFKGGIRGVNFIFLTVGRLVPVKNISLQIEAMQKL